MTATTAIPLSVVNVPKVPKIKVRMPKTVTGVYVSAHTPLPIAIALDEEPEYSDEQFYADLRKASKQLDAMEQQALEEYRQGKTRKFPV